MTDTSKEAVARLVAGFRTEGGGRMLLLADWIEALARERDELQRERERVVCDLKPLHDLADPGAWGSNVCAWAAEKIKRMRAALNNLSPDTLSPQEIMNGVAWALEQPRKTYSGDMHPDKSLFDLCRERDALAAKNARLREHVASLVSAGNRLHDTLNPLMDFSPEWIARRRKDWENAAVDAGIEIAQAVARQALGETERPAEP